MFSMKRGSGESRQRKKEQGEKFSSSARDLFFLFFIAAAFHGIFFLLFRPLESDRRENNSRKGFTLILPRENIKAAAAQYGLEYWLKYAQTPGELKMQQEAGFTARLLRSDSSFLTAKQLLKDYSAVPGGQTVASAQKKKSSAAKISLSEFSGKALQAEEELFTGKTPEKKNRWQRMFPRWKFSTGEVFYGWPFAAESASNILALHAKKVTSSTVCRIVFDGPEIPGRIDLIRSCGVPELDILAERQLAAFAGTGGEKEKKSSFILCAVLWGEDLLYSRKSAEGYEKNIQFDKRKRNSEK